MSELDYFRSYKNCSDYCGNPPIEELTECINDIRSDYDDEGLCSNVELDCQITRTEQFRNLLLFLVSFLKILYCSRSINGNIYDMNIITCLGLLDLNDFGLSAQDLECVKLQDFVKSGMPNNLCDYFLVMKEIRKIISSGEPLEETARSNNILKDYTEFVSDYQPWSRLLYTVVDKYVKELDIMPRGIPDITRPKDYGDFISECDETKMARTIDEMSKDPTYIIRSLMTGGKRKLTRRKSMRRRSIRRRSRKSRRSGKRRL